MQTKRELLVSDGWLQAVALVGLCGFLLLGILAYRTDTDEPSSKVIGPDGQLLFTGEDVLAGQEVLLKNDLMEYGSIFSTARILDGILRVIIFIAPRCVSGSSISGWKIFSSYSPPSWLPTCLCFWA